MPHKYKMAFLGMTAALLAGMTNAAERGGGLAARTHDTRASFTLKLDDYWRLTAPKKQRFDASGLLKRGQRLFTVNDRGPELFEITTAADHSGELRASEFFTRSALEGIENKKPAAPHARYDCEGIASDEQGNLYVCEESQRIILRSSPDGRQIGVLDFDWTSVASYFRGGINASFEGIAIGNGKLYLSNERDHARLIVADLSSGKVEGSFFVDSVNFAIGGPHYSDLAFAAGHLFVLDRNHRCVLEVDPLKRTVIAEYGYGATEVSEEFAYHTDYPTGTMEGLAVDERYFWLITDNNGRSRFKDKSDFRPTLFRFERPRQVPEAINRSGGRERIPDHSTPPK